MTDTTDTIELIDRAEIKDGQAIVAYSRTEAALASLREKYKDARYDLTTTAGDRAARAARLELTTTRTSLEKKRKELKAPAVEFGRKVDAEAARLTAELLALENPIDAQIKADEKRREEERRAKEEAEAARRKVHTDGIAKIAGYVGQAADLPAARIAAGITYLDGLDLSGFEEFTEEATATRNRTVAALRALQVKAQAREDEAARLEAERIEQARVAAEQAETARQLKAQQEALAQQAAALAEQQAKLQREEEARARAQAQREQAARDEEARQQRAAAEEVQRREAAALAELQRQEQPAATPAPARTASTVEAPTEPSATIHPMPTRAPTAPAGPPTLRLGEIQKRLAPVDIDDAGLTALGFPPAGREGAAKLRHESAFPAICDAILAHVAAARAQHLEAA